MIDRTNIKQHLLRYSVLEEGPLPTRCLVWTLASHPEAYGSVTYKGRSQPVHRVAWQEFVGPFPKGRLICHKCDNPPCWRIEHLYCGTYATNMQDMIDRGRTHKGLFWARLSKEQVLKIRRMTHEARSGAKYFEPVRPEVHLDCPGIDELVNELIAEATIF